MWRGSVAREECTPGRVPLYRQPNTLGWAGLDSQLPPTSRSAEEIIDFSSALFPFLRQASGPALPS